MPPWIENSGTLITLIGGIVVLFGSAFAVFGVYVQNRATEATDKEIIAKTEENARLALENAAKSEELAAYATGGDSYIFLHLEGFGTEKPKAMIRHVGKYPVRDTEIMVFDVTGQAQAILGGTKKKYDLPNDPLERQHVRVVYPEWSGTKYLTKYPFVGNPTKAFYFYLIVCDSHNGKTRQHLQMAKVDGEWSQAYKIDRQIGDIAVDLQKYSTPDFPEDAWARIALIEESH